ncbi:hypothetical protein, variant 2 [Phytophthora nicotianae P1976]|uniref:START domain-containing protein n=2 Tax=Phytophthora nicotianae P1976 TaxID=1317066 RepID=A0A080ZV16_PHYNI|nr:hypothetical protein, variant 2 [Phytophthora nicotianae P1976]
MQEQVKVSPHYLRCYPCWGPYTAVMLVHNSKHFAPRTSTAFIITLTQTMATWWLCSDFVATSSSRIIPFDCKIVGDAFWYEVTKTGVENKVEPGKPPQKEKATVILQSFIMEMEQDGSPVKIQFRYATKRVVDEHREVVAFSGQSQVREAFGAVISGVRCREKHWFVLSEISPGVTMVKVCMSRVVNFDCDLPLCQPFVDRTIQMLAKQKQMGFEALLEDVERRLFVGCQ